MHFSVVYHMMFPEDTNSPTRDPNFNKMRDPHFDKMQDSCFSIFLDNQSGSMCLKCDFKGPLKKSSKNMNEKSLIQEIFIKTLWWFV